MGLKELGLIKRTKVMGLLIYVRIPDFKGRRAKLQMIIKIVGSGQSVVVHTIHPST